MVDPDFSGATWRKSSESANGDCVEVAWADGRIGVRDSKDSGRGPVLAFTEREWAAFLGGARGGEFEIADLRD